MTPSDPRPAAVVVLAAGEGTRMRSATPKVLHALAGRTLLGHVLAAVAGLRPDAVLVVVGHERERVAEHLAAAPPAGAAVSVVVQDEQLGTGHAVRVALEAHPGTSGTVLVVCGDTPLLRTESLSALLVEHAERGDAASVLTARVADPTGYGRVLRDSDGAVTAIVEHRDADDRQRAVGEVNSGIYAFQADALSDALGRLTRDNSQGEEYLTDVVALLVGDGRRVGAVTVADPDEVLGVNDRAQLAEVGRLLRDRLVRDWMLAGVTVVDPTTCWVDVDVVLEPDAVVLPGAILRGATRIGRGAQVGPNVTLTDTVVAEGATVADATCVGAEVGPGASVGPYTYLRPGTRLGPGSRAGGFVEMKNAVVGEGSKVPHLSYVGDARIGTGSNIGAATVFVNYDGVAKHATVVGDDVRIGSDTMLVAPVTIGDGAYTAAGSVITDDVPPGAMGVGRARQRTIEGWVERKRPGTASAAAAKRAAHAATTDQTGDDAAEGGRQG